MESYRVAVQLKWRLNLTVSMLQIESDFKD